MPEGDSIYQLSRRLQFMVGRRVEATSIRVPQFSLTDFTGEHVDRVWPYGKNLFMQFGELTMQTHLKMEGSWAIHLRGDKWTKPAHTARVVLQLEGAPQPRPLEIVGHSLGMLRVFPTRLYPEKIADAGPDILGKEWETHGLMEATRRILNRPQRSIGTALLDQRNVAGIGNEYRAEICFVMGIHPAMPVSELGPAGIEETLRTARRLMWANRLTPIRNTTGIKRAGENTYVFGRNHKRCRRCGTPIVKDVLGGPDAGGDRGELTRIIWVCPRCQPL